MYLISWILQDAVLWTGPCQAWPLLHWRGPVLQSIYRSPNRACNGLVTGTRIGAVQPNSKQLIESIDPFALFVSFFFGLSVVVEVYGTGFLPMSCADLKTLHIIDVSVLGEGLDSSLLAEA